MYLLVKDVLKKSLNLYLIASLTLIWWGKQIFHKCMLYFQTFEREEAEYAESRVQGHLTRQDLGAGLQMGRGSNFRFLTQLS